MTEKKDEKSFEPNLYIVLEHCPTEEFPEYPGVPQFRHILRQFELMQSGLLLPSNKHEDPSSIIVKGSPEITDGLARIMAGLPLDSLPLESRIWGDYKNPLAEFNVLFRNPTLTLKLDLLKGYRLSAVNGEKNPALRLYDLAVASKLAYEPPSSSRFQVS